MQHYSCIIYYCCPNGRLSPHRRTKTKTDAISLKTDSLLPMIVQRTISEWWGHHLPKQVYFVVYTIFVNNFKWGIIIPTMYNVLSGYSNILKYNTRKKTIQYLYKIFVANVYYFILLLCEYTNTIYFFF